MRDPEHDQPLHALPDVVHAGVGRQRQAIPTKVFDVRKSIGAPVHPQSMPLVGLCVTVVFVTISDPGLPGPRKRIAA